MNNERCKKCGKDMSEEDFCYNFPDGVQCIDCGKGRKVLDLSKLKKEDYGTSKPCKKCGRETLTLEWKLRNGICCLCATKEQMEVT
jgi:hypothetical protein